MEMQDALAILSALQILHHQSGASHLAPSPHFVALPQATMTHHHQVVDVNQLLLLSAAQYPGALSLSVPFLPFGLPPLASPSPAAFAPAPPTTSPESPHESLATANRSRRRVSMTSSPSRTKSSPITAARTKMDINFLTSPTEGNDDSFGFDHNCFDGAFEKQDASRVESSSPLSSPRQSPRSSLGRSCGEESPLHLSPAPPSGGADHDNHPGRAGDRVVLQLAAEEAKERWQEREESMVSLKHTHKAIAANRQAQQKQKRRKDQLSSTSPSASSSSQEDEDEDEDEDESDGALDETGAAGRSRERRVMTGRTCLHCGITSTPEWRTGPDGKGTLCNACGLRYRKFVRAEEKRGVVIAFPAMPALAKPRKRRRPAHQPQQLDEKTKQDNRDHKKKRKATTS